MKSNIMWKPLPQGSNCNYGHKRSRRNATKLLFWNFFTSEASWIEHEQISPRTSYYEATATRLVRFALRWVVVRWRYNIIIIVIITELVSDETRYAVFIACISRTKKLSFKNSLKIGLNGLYLQKPDILGRFTNCSLLHFTKEPFGLFLGYVLNTVLW